MNIISFDVLRDSIVDNQAFQKTCQRYAQGPGSSEAIAMAVLSAAGFPDLYIDAMRYRWLRARTLENIEPESPVAVMSPQIALLADDDLDFAIDSAMTLDAALDQTR